MPVFSTDFAPPDPPSGFTIFADIEASAVRLAWEASTIAQVDFNGFRVYRSLDGGTTWHLMRTYPLVSDTSHDDFETPLNVSALYRVTQSNLDLESDPAEGATELASRAWWVVFPNDSALTFPIAKVRGAQATSHKVQEVFGPIGRPEKLVVGDVVRTEDGSLTFLVMPDQPGMVALLKMVQSRMDGSILLKAPDGVNHHVQLGDMSRAFTNIEGLQELTLSWLGAS